MNERTKNLIHYVVPTILSSICYFLFTIIDGIFVGNGVGTDALGAINLIFPFIMVGYALLQLTVIGSVTVTAIRLGRGDRDGANQVFMHALLLLLTIALLIFVVGVFFTGPVCRLLGANETYFRLARDYLFWYSLFAVPSSLGVLLMGFCRNDGSPGLVGAATIISTALNIFGDWLLIFPLQMGIRGAAVATGISESVAMLIVLTHFLRRRGQLRFRLCPLRRDLFGKIVKRGLPELIAQFSTPLTVMCMNYMLLSRLGNLAINSYALICYVASFSVAVFIGAADGLQPLYGRSYGARNEKELHFYFRSGLLIVAVGSSAITAALFFIGVPVCALFGPDAATLRFTGQTMMRYAWGFIPMALNAMIAAYLFSTKRTRQAVIINSCRSYLFNIACVLLLPLLFGNGMIWFSFGVGECLTLIVALILCRRSERGGVPFH